eukprot:TRINITY_DN4526_c0_g2_i8.p1 TRINITY_DN4526_c0_g2~~TRINITY_DN4526_c0_g2_i8.p1  ORF type:complete len:189 (-),score=15.73 TRINITY_DN4526_c0_g2_i8:350-916(-)
MEPRKEEGNQLSEYESGSDCEEFGDYKVDGYHPVALGESFNSGNYSIIQKLGWGYFSTVWLVNLKKTDTYFAMKVQKSKKSYCEAAEDELKLLTALKENINNPIWLETVKEYNALYRLELTPETTFTVRMVDGIHYCTVFEILGPNLLSLIQHYEFDSINANRASKNNHPPITYGTRLHAMHLVFTRI